MVDENLTQPQEGTNPESEVETTETTPEETGESQVQESTEDMIPKSTLNQVLARAKRAEEELKKYKSSPQNITKNSLSEEEVEIKILKAQGMETDLLNELKAVAKARGKGIIESTSDPIFIAIKEKREADTKVAKAKLGASRGANQAKKEKDINSSGLSDTEHKELWRQQNVR